MAGFKSEFLRVLDERGFIFQQTDADGLDRLAQSDSLTCYIGFDCTAPSLHVGNLVSIMMLRWAQKTGHRPVVLMGGGTTKIGDPSGKDETRKLLTVAEIDRNKTGILHRFECFLTFGNGPADAIMVDNAEWLDKLEYIPFLREIGRHFTVNRMLAFDSVKRRLEREQPLSFLEFNYMILQAYDFLELARREDCRLQMGGSDQWGNIVSGIELGRRVDGRELFGLTTPLITTAGGQKMGKTAQGAVWLDERALPAYDYWQFWRNTADADVGRFLRLFTELPMDEIARLAALEGQEINEAKKILATEATALCHGRQAAQNAAETARRTFEQGETGEDLHTLVLDRGLRDGVALVDLLVETGLVSSKKEARRLIRQGGARVDGETVSDEDARLYRQQFDEGGVLRLSAGKKRHVRVRLG